MTTPKTGAKHNYTAIAAILSTVKSIDPKNPAAKSLLLQGVTTLGMIDKTEMAPHRAAALTTVEDKAEQIGCATDDTVVSFIASQKQSANGHTAETDRNDRQPRATR